jgi:hypothetical protein
VYVSVGLHCAKLDVVRSLALQRIANRFIYSLAVLRMNQRRKILYGAAKFAALDTVNVVDEIRPFDRVLDNVPIPDSDLSGIERKFSNDLRYP